MASFQLRLIPIALLVALSLSACDKSGSVDNLLKEAKAAVDKRDPKAAEIHLKNILQKTPENVEARFLLGQVYYQSADFRTAEKELRRAVEGGYDRTVAVPMLFHSMLQIGEFQRVIDEYQGLVVEGAANKAKVLDQVGRAYLALGKKDDSQRVFQEALTLAPNFAAARAGLIGIMAGTDRETARGHLKDLVKAAPESFEAAVLEGDFALTDNKLPEAKKAFAKAVAIDANNALAHAKLGAILIDLKEYPEAKKEIVELLRIAPASPAGFHLQALYDFRQGNITPARDAIAQSLRIAPDYLPAIALSGNIFLNLGQNEQAERQARILVERAPGSLQGFRLLGATYLRMNAPERALAVVLPLIEKGVQDATIFTIAGEAYLKANESAKAGSYFDQALKLDPTDPSKRTGLALSRMAMGERDKAFDDLEAAVLLDTDGFQADFALIMARVREKQFDKAMEAVDRLEKKQPKNPISFNMRGMVLLAKDDVPNARKAFEQALTLDPKFFPAAANLASLDTRDNKPDLAKQRYQTVLEKDPKNSQALIALARHIARAGGAKKEVLDLLLRAKSSNPGAVPPVLALANYYMENDQPRDAIPLLQEGLQQNPERPEMLELLGMSYMRVNERSQAVEAFDRLIRLDPKSATMHYRMGELKAAMRDETGAIASFRRASELQPKAVEPRIAIASLLLRTGKKEEARKMAVDLQKDLPSSPAGLLLEGDLHASDQKWEAASVSFKKAYAVMATPGIAAKVHQALARNGKANDAAAFLDQAVAAAPKNLQMRLYAGEAEIAKERWSQAAGHYKLVLDQEPNNGLALNNMAWASYKLNDPKAIKYAEQAYQVLPQAPAVIDTYGYLLVLTGNVNRGVDLLKQASAMAPKASDIRLHLAEGYLKLGDKENAKKEAESALRDNPPEGVAAQLRALIAKI
jgi:cellulose synthase operon protein C